MIHFDKISFTFDQALLETMVALFISPSYSDLIVFVTFIVILVVRQLIIIRRK